MLRRRTKPPPLLAPVARGRRLLFACLAMAMVVAQLLGVSHLVFVSHALCEHGALQHVETAAHLAGAVAADAKKVPSAVPGHAAGEHEHCDLFARQHPAVTVEPSFAVPELLDASPLACHPGSPLACQAISILALAPKGSPPAQPFLAS